MRSNRSCRKILMFFFQEEIKNMQTRNGITITETTTDDDLAHHLEEQRETTFNEHTRECRAQNATNIPKKLGRTPMKCCLEQWMKKTNKNCLCKSISLKTEKNGKNIEKKCTLIKKKRKKQKKTELTIS